MIILDKIKYQKYIEEITPKTNKLKNALVSFFSGGIISIIGLLLFNIFNNYYNQELSISFMIITLIFITSVITCSGFGDELFSKLQCGLIIPITGFSHSITSSILDYKKEGLITMGSNAFKLAGSVILYGITSSIIFTLIKVIIIDKF